MTYKKYYDLIRDAMEIESSEQFVGEIGFPDWLNEECGGDVQRAIEILDNIHEIANMSIKDMRHSAKMTQVKFAERFNIKKRTLESWEMGDRLPTESQRLMMAELLGLVKVPLE